MSPYMITARTPGVDSLLVTRMSQPTWETSLFECCATKECGANCAVQHCCCQPCIVSSSLRRGGLRDADLIGVSLILGGNSVLDEIAGYFARRSVIRKYDIEESELRSLLVSCCCAPLSNLQLVNTIVVREDLSYGCAHVRPSSTTPHTPSVSAQARDALRPPPRPPPRNTPPSTNRMSRGV